MEKYKQLSLFEMTVDMDALIDALLHIGSNFAYSKARIYDQFSTDATITENVAFLKREYGIGGHSCGFDGNDLFVDYDGKGIRCRSFGREIKTEIDINLNWTQVAKRIKQAVTSGEYITQAQYDSLKKEEADYLEYWRQRGI